MRGTEKENGQASVELVALLPLIASVLALVIQCALAGQALWLSQSAARAAARAEAVGADSDRAARGALPDRLERGMELRDEGDGRVAVRVRIPALVGGDLGTTVGSARMEPQK